MPIIEPPSINIKDSDLNQVGFTSSGRAKFKHAIQDFSNQVFDKAIKFADIDRMWISREVTHDHVTSASALITRTFWRKHKSNWWVMAHILEYICAIGAGVWWWNLTSNWGILVLACSTAVWVLLIVVRIKD